MEKSFRIHKEYKEDKDKEEERRGFEKEMRNEGWITNFSNYLEEAYLLLQQEYKGPGKIVFKEPIGNCSARYSKSCWIEPPPENWKAFYEWKNKTGFKEKFEQLFKLENDF